MTKKYIIDVNSTPEEKWKNILDDHKKECLRIFDIMEREYFSRIPSYIYYPYYYTLNYLIPSSNFLYYDELKYISEYLGITFDRILITQLIYEISAACTSAMVNVNGENIHWRSMDWSMPFLKDVTIQMDFIKNEDPLYTAITWVGYVGCFTGIKNGKYSIALNYRRSDGTLIGNLKKLIMSYWPAGYLIRELLESDYDINKVKTNLENALLVSPTYFSLCSCKDNMYVIIRDSDKCKDILKTKKHIVQTNKDPDDHETNILLSQQRQKKAELIICKIKKSEDIFKLDTEPLINSETIYRSIMIPSYGVIDTKIIN